jgi:hypothetical protein
MASTTRLASPKPALTVPVEVIMHWYWETVAPLLWAAAVVPSMPRYAPVKDVAVVPV